MAFTRDLLQFVDGALAICDRTLPNRRMLELGDQVVLDAPDLPGTGRGYFEARGFAHTSVDLNEHDGALPYDLSKPLPRPDWTGRFGVLTNAGTTEHVEPFNAQYTCFAELHRVLAVGGLAIHIVPDAGELDRTGEWKYHCNNYYSAEFFNMLAKANGYRIVAKAILMGHCCAALQKEQDSTFMTDRRLFLSGITRRSGGVIYQGINGGLLSRVYHKVYRTLRG